MDETIHFCEQQGYVKTLLNRRRYLPDINSKNINMKQFAQRQAINTPVQGSAADIMKLVMIKIEDQMRIKKLKSRMIMTVHDELVFNVKQEEFEEMTHLVHQEMEGVIQLKVPLIATLKSGKDWLEMTEVQL